MTWETGKSLMEYGMRRANELDVAPNDDFVADYKDYLNLAYWDIIGEFPWSWATKYPPGQLTTLDWLMVTATCSEDSPVVALASSPGTVAGRKFVMENDGIPMRILSVTGSELTLAAPYPQSSSGPGRIFQDEYQLPDDVMSPVRLDRLVKPGEIELTSAQLFAGSYGGNVTSGIPQHYTWLTDRYIRLGRWPDRAQPLEFWYTYVPPPMDFSGATATDTPIMPLHVRWIIADRALFYLLTDMDDNKAAIVTAQASARLNEEKAREINRLGARFWVPSRHRVARSRL